MPRRPPNRTRPAPLSDRNRKALQALRELWAKPPARTDAEREAWIREIRLTREESTRHLLEKIARRRKRLVAPPPDEGRAPESSRP